MFKSVVLEDRVNDDILSLRRLHEFVCSELSIPAADVARQVSVAFTVSAAFYASRDDDQIIQTVFKAMAA